LGAIALLSFGPSSLELLKTNNYNIKIFKKLEIERRGRAYLLACYSMRWRDLNLKMNKNYILYTLKP
jgi:hypothetical protein